MPDYRGDLRRQRAGGFFSHLARWLYTLFWMGARCRCPRCESGPMFESFYEIHKQCPECGIKFQPFEGDILGVIATAYFLTVAPALVGTCLAYAYLPLGLMGDFLVFMAITSTVLLGFFRNMKGIWVAFMYLLTGLRPGAIN